MIYWTTGRLPLLCNAYYNTLYMVGLFTVTVKFNCSIHPHKAVISHVEQKQVLTNVLLCRPRRALITVNI